jgi:hypothetical protein
MSTSVEPGTWREYGLGGPPEPWEHGDQLDLDRLATSYYVDVLESRRRIIESAEAGDADDQVEAEELLTLATGHKQEIDFSLRHEATPAERGRVEDRLQALMRISRRLRELAERVTETSTSELVPKG